MHDISMYICVCSKTRLRQTVYPYLHEWKESIKRDIWVPPVALVGWARDQKVGGTMGHKPTFSEVGRAAFQT